MDAKAMSAIKDASVEGAEVVSVKSSMIEVLPFAHSAP
jgi:hypothetical protein